MYFGFFWGKKITVMDPGIAMYRVSGPTTTNTVAMILNHVLYYFLLFRLPSIQYSLGTSGNICKKLLAWHINVFDCVMSLIKLLMYFFFTTQVLPSLREKHDEFMLRELVKRWANHKVMVRWLSRFFHYLDRYFIARRSLPALNEVGLTCFRELVLE